MTQKYLFKTDSALGRLHMNYLEQLLDGPTTACLDEIGIQPDWRCLDLGAGGGSISRWLADRAGQVVAVDLDTDYLGTQPGIEVHRHDINDGLPVEGPFQLIHARLLLLHLPRRVEILRTLVDALAPGGWLVLGEFSDRPRRVLSAPSDADAQLFDRIQEVAHTTVGDAAGISIAWAHEVDRHMTDAGLTNMRGAEYSQTTAGGTAGCLLHRNLVMQAEATLLRAGLTDEELARYGDLMLDSRFRAWFYQYVCTWGQKPGW